MRDWYQSTYQLVVPANTSDRIYGWGGTYTGAFASIELTHGRDGELGITEHAPVIAPRLAPRWTWWRSVPIGSPSYTVYLVYPGPETYPIESEITVMSLLHPN